MQSVFWKQYWALWRKNWIVLSKHKLLNILRCFIFPIAYGIFLAVAQLFLLKPNKYGLGTPAPIRSLSTAFDPSLKLVWADETGGNTSPSPSDVMALLAQSLNPAQRASIVRVASADAIPDECPQNFNLFSQCFAAVAFNTFPSPSDPIALNISALNTTLPTFPSNLNLTDPSTVNLTTLDPRLTDAPNGTLIYPPSTLINYTLRGDAGFGFIDVINHKSDFELRILPLQWALDSAIIRLQTNSSAPPTPLEWPYSIETDEEQSLDIRLSYIRGLRTLLVFALFINFLGIPYQLPGSYVTERTLGLTSHMKAMGLRDFPRILSWHTSISAAYLPAWIITALVWHFRIFTGTNVGIMIVIHLLTGLSLASYSFTLSLLPLPAALAASISTFVSVLLALLALVLSSHASNGAATIFTLIFPPGFFIFAVRCLAGWELHQIPSNVVKRDPDSGLIMISLWIVALITIFLYPYLAIVLERKYYDAHDAPAPKTKTNSKRSWLPVPRKGIFVLLGSNGAGKSTALGVMAGLIGKSGGRVVFPARDSKPIVRDVNGGDTGNGVGEVDGDNGVEWEGPSKPPKGSLGIVPQRNVLFPELSCFETVKVWRDLKRRDWGAGRKSEIPIEETDADLIRLLIDCGLEGKIHANAGSLSGGQKRKLQLAIGLVGGSEIVLVDECTSGVDPLSRRSIWRTLTNVKTDRTIVFTTHFLDEADLLADNIAILAAPGKLVAAGSPVSLKSRLGKGYRLQVSFDSLSAMSTSTNTLLSHLRAVAPEASVLSSAAASRSVEYALNSRGTEVVRGALEVVQDHVRRGEMGLEGYQVHGTTIEDIFLELMGRESGIKIEAESRSSTSVEIVRTPAPLSLTSSRKRSAYSQSLTILYKRTLILKRSFLSPLLTILVAICGACIPIFFLSGRDPNTCRRAFAAAPSAQLYLGDSSYASVFNQAIPNPSGQVVISPPNLLDSFKTSLGPVHITSLPSNQSFVSNFQTRSRNFSLGGLSMDTQSGEALIAWEASPIGLTSATLLNLASNVLYNRALNSTGAEGVPRIIAAAYQAFPALAPGTLVALKWIAFFGLTMAVYPAFFALYPTMERRSSIQAMQLSNGLINPIGLWLGHLMFDGVFVVILSTIIVIIFATVSDQFNGIGYMWLVLVLYGWAAALFAYCVSLFTPSPLAAFAAMAGYQALFFILYLAGYLLIITYAKNSAAAGLITIIHFTIAPISPVGSVLRAALVSVNLFSLLCSNEEFDASSLGTIKKFGSPIAYLIVQIIVLFAFLIYYDSGSILPRWLQFGRPPSREANTADAGMPHPKDIAEEIEAVENSSEDYLRVLHVSKTFKGSDTKAVDDVSFGVSHDTVFAMLGPNGAGKTSTFNIIRGDIYPDSGDVFINNSSIISNPNTARLSLGVCPQFTAIDPQLTVRQHLIIYGLLKGLQKGAELDQNVATLLRATTLTQYADRLANKLSGGNQRKLSFAIAMIGNPSVILIDEYSTGIDAATKRSMWVTFRRMAVGKAVVITTHSMEEASALANKVGILAGRMLAIGTTDTLASRYALYEVHFPARTREEIVKAQQLMSRIPGSRMADDVATRFEVPIRTDAENRAPSTAESSSVTSKPNIDTLSLAQLFDTLSSQNDFPEYTVERISLESVFLKVIREHNIQEENSAVEKRKKRFGIF
ncbi:hypothetical protein M422DRAFT_77023 [Sphaerobolus stellatus SS14]|uniref:ABC transporter domain-containing protein n=1 Tax=Sphaerobolus stellatus (strain SS14) TaxID=990650 RepID=A0A0C9TB38_SPHS4|nr:hypothetical protein M422DRAFT_77023 [Sphaerobolus stellatus SS14]